MSILHATLILKKVHNFILKDNNDLKVLYLKLFNIYLKHFLTLGNNFDGIFQYRLKQNTYLIYSRKQLVYATTPLARYFIVYIHLVLYTARRERNCPCVVKGPYLR